MAPDDSSGARPAPVVLRIKLRYDDVEAMIARFAPNVGKTGLFLPTKSLQPLGAEIKFELRLANDQPVLVGLGRVKAVREPDPENPTATFGMAIELMRVTRESRDLILKILERRKQLGLPETGLPMPADIDAARRSDFIDTGVKDATSGAIPQLISAIDSAPSPSHSPSSSTTEALMTAPRRQTGPIAVAKMAIVEPLAPEPSRKRRVPVAELIATASGPIVASFTTDVLDDDVDVAAVLARARTLAKGSSNDLDGELAKILDEAAAPIEIGIEAASAELARQLGGAAVRRDRSGSARWAPPPPTSEAPATNGAAVDHGEPPPVLEAKPEAPELEAKPEAPEPEEPELEAKPEEPKPEEPKPKAIIEAIAPEPVAPQPVAPEPVAPEPAATEIDGRHRGRDDDDDDGDFVDRQRDESTPVAAPLTPSTGDDDDDSGGVPTQDDDDAPLFERAPRRPSFAPENAQLTTEPRPGLIHDDADASQFESGGDDAQEVLPEQIHDEIHRLDEGDFEEVEHTQIGEQPVDPAAFDPAAFDQHAYATLPAEHAAIADRLDAQLEEAEREDLGFAEPPVEVGEEEEIEEIDDFEILAEADAEDADLLASAAEHEVSGERRPASYGTPEAFDEVQPQGYAHSYGQQQTYEPPHNPFDEQEPAAPDDHGFELPPARPSFLNRLSLDDDSGYHIPAASQHFDDLSPEPGEIDPRHLSAGHALRAFEDPDEHSDFNAPGSFTPVPPLDPYRADSVGEQSYTFANSLAGDEFDAPHGNYAREVGQGRADSDLDPGSSSGSFIPPDAFDQSDVISIRPATSQPRTPQPGDEDFPDLESALEALDVDLDDLGRPGAGGQPRRPARGPSGARSVRAGNASEVPTARGRRESNLATSPTVDAGAHNARRSGQVPRAKTEDGIEIDFDDDE